jgi:hypothetical protein
MRKSRFSESQIVSILKPGGAGASWALSSAVTS